MRLDEIASQWESVEAALEMTGGELTPALEANLEALNLAEREKVDGYVFKVKALEGECESLKKLKDEIDAKIKARQKLREWLLNRARLYMEQRDTRVLQGQIFRMQLVASGRPPVEVLVPPEELPEGWRITEYKANKEKIREYLESGDATIPALARLGEPTLSVRIS